MLVRAEGTLSALPAGVRSRAATVENGLAVPPQRGELAILLLGKRPKELKRGTETDIRPPCTAALLPKAKGWKQPKRPLSSDWTGKI